ncbi:MAG: glycosyltransferase family 4 protein, partial [Candidatus Bathyarchaeia archaeon]
METLKFALTLYDANFLGGGNKLTAELVCMLVRRGHQVALCTANRPEEGRCHDALLNLDPVFTARPLKPTRKAKLYVSSILVATALRRCLRSFNPDVVINADAPPATFGLLSSSRAKLIQYVHWPTELQSYRHSIPLELYRALYWGLHYM